MRDIHILVIRKLCNIIRGICAVQHLSREHNLSCLLPSYPRRIHIPKLNPDWTVVERTDLVSMSTDELWKLHENVVTKLAADITRQKILLEDRLKQLTRQIQTEPQGKEFGRRSYPKVSPKFRNPDQPSETWSGRGRQPRWLTAQLRSGKRIDDFRIEHAA